MAKEIDKIIQSKTAPKSNNVLWDDGENLKIYRKGRWEEANKGGSSSELYAYPVDTLDGKENKVIGLGGDAFYVYAGELVASEDGPTEEKVIGEVFHTDYSYQPIYDGKYFDSFSSYVQDKYITLYIGDDVDGYSSNKVYISEDINNLTYYDFNFVGGFGPRSLKVAISPDYMLHYKNYWHYANKNSKVFFATYKQQLDINLIPEEIVRKEDLPTESRKAVIDYNTSSCQGDFINYQEEVNIRHGLHIYLGELGAKSLTIGNYIEGIPVLFQYEREDKDNFYYSSDVADIRINKKTNALDPGLNDTIVHGYYLSPKKLIATVEYDEYNQTFDFSKVKRTQCSSVIDTNRCTGIRLYFEMGHDDNVNIIDSAYYFKDWGSDGIDSSFYCVYLRNKYIEFKIVRTEEVFENTKYYCSSLEITKEVDIPSLESRLAALEAKIQ